MSYLYIVFNIDNLPFLALNDEFLLISGFREKESIGVFTEAPHAAAMAFAIIYYLWLAFTEFNVTKSLIKNPKRFSKPF